MKPAARLLFCEHGLAPDRSVARWQNAINPLWRHLAGGCNINRDIPALIGAGGFEIETLETMYLPGTARVAGFNFWGGAKAL